jgi:DNA-binding response OmpR family regulator
MSRILIIEDDERIRSSLRLMFEGEGFDVEESATGEEGLEAFRRLAADLCVVDVMLPGIDGFETSRQLRATSEVPIVIVSARDDTSDVVAGLEAGADDYVTKPFSPTELLRVFEPTCDVPRRRPSPSLSATSTSLPIRERPFAPTARVSTSRRPSFDF